MFVLCGLQSWCWPCSEQQCKCERWQLAAATGRDVASGPASHQSWELQVRRKQHVMELIHSSSRMFYIANICWCLMTRGMPGNILLPSLPRNMIQPLPLAVTNPPPLTMVFIAAAKYFPAMRDERGPEDMIIKIYASIFMKSVSVMWRIWAVTSVYVGSYRTNYRERLI